jgi:alpha-beta hydrolase superfamily lysophospholipase
LKDENILPLSNLYKKEGYFTGKENIEIYYKIFKQTELESPAILISSGRTEAAIKYKDFLIFITMATLYIS